MLGCDGPGACHHCDGVDPKTTPGRCVDCGGPTPTYYSSLCPACVAAYNAKYGPFPEEEPCATAKRT